MSSAVLLICLISVNYIDCRSASSQNPTTVKLLPHSKSYY
jgi:hypothetical protein